MRRALLVLLLVAAAAVVILFGFGRWSEDECINDARMSGVPEGSLGTQAVRAWPPGVHCRWRTPQGERIDYDVELF